MTEKPLVSILVPVYGVEKYIERCARSLFEQTIENIEFIFVNDCTKDDSIKVLEQVIEDYPNRKEQIKIIHHEKNKGLACSRNTAFECSQGHYIVCVDSDDWTERNYVEKLYTIAKNNDADIVCCNLIKEYVDKSVKMQCKIPADHQVLIKQLLEGEVKAWLPIKLFRKNLFVKNSIRWIPHIDMWEDVLISLKSFFYAHKIIYIDDYLYHYSYNFSSIANTFNEKRIINFLNATSEIESFFYHHNSINTYKCSIDVLKSRVKTNIILDAPDDDVRSKYMSIFYEIDTNIIKTRQIPLMKRIAVLAFIHHLSLLGKVIINIISIYRKIRYKTNLLAK